MNPRSGISHAYAQRGGITILVVLSLLVLLTIAAVGMSRNSLREVLIVASSRQSASVRHAADSGIEFAILWADPQNPSTGTGTTFQRVMRSQLEDPESQGIYTDIASGADTTLNTSNGVTQSFRLRLLRLGKLPIGNTSIQDERLYNDIWVTRAIGEVKLGSGLGNPDFQHHKEMWLTTPAQTE